MRIVTHAAFAAAILSGAAAAPLAGQQDTLAPPRHAVALQVGQAGEIELWQRLSPGLEAGIGVGMGLSGGHATAGGERVRSHGYGLRLEPALKIYLSPSAPVRPFGYVSAGLERQRGEDEGETTGTTRVRTVFGSAGVGVEWFPLRRVSFGGYGALSANRQVVTRRFTNPALPPASESDTQRSFGSICSGLRVQLYF